MDEENGWHVSVREVVQTVLESIAGGSITHPDYNWPDNAPPYNALQSFDEGVISLSFPAARSIDQCPVLVTISVEYL